MTVRVDDDVPAGDLVNIAEVSAPGDTPTSNNRDEATTTVHFAGLGDFVWWDQNHDGLQTAGEPGFGGVTVHLYDAAGTLVGTTTTDAGGYYRFDRLRPTTNYAVCLDNPADTATGGPLAGFEPTHPNVGTDDAIDSDGVLVNGVPCATPAPTGAAGSFIPTYDFGFWKPAALGDRVWSDLDHNGIQDVGEPGVSGVGVTLFNATGAPIATTTTDANGLYLFDRLDAGTYHVCFLLPTIPAGYMLTIKDAPAIDAGQRLRRRHGRLCRLDDARPRPARSRLGRGDLAGTAGAPVRPADLRRLVHQPSGKPKLQLTKVGRPGTVRAGGRVNYTLVVKNTGTANAHDVKVCDTLPAGVTVTSTGGGKLANGVVCWSMKLLPKGRHKQFGLIVKVDVTQRVASRTRRSRPRATPERTASTSTNVTLPKPRSGVAGVTG